MTTTISTPVETAAPAGGHPRSGMPVWRLAWRNLWRNRRRSWLTVSGIAFAVFLLVLVMAIYDGVFGTMIDTAGKLLPGTVQVQHPDYQDDPSMEARLRDAPGLIADAERLPGVTAALPRVQSFVLLSAGERSFGGQLMGVDPAREAAATGLPSMQPAGRYLGGPGEAFIGSALARNLGLEVGDELVMLGTALGGGVAAHAATVVGTFTTGQAGLDRSLVQIPIDDFRAAWNLEPDALHTLALMSPSAVSAAAATALAAPGRRVLDWPEVMPELQQLITAKYAGGAVLFAVIAVIVVFSVVNTFMMVVFERTPEFGMLRALGMRQSAITAQLCVEALWLAVLGVAVGAALGAALCLWLGSVGIPIMDMYPEDMLPVARAMGMPEMMRPEFGLKAVFTAALVFFIGTQIAVLIPARRAWRLSPVDALRSQE